MDRLGELPGGLKKGFFQLSGVIHPQNGHRFFILYIRRRTTKTDTETPVSIPVSKLLFDGTEQPGLGVGPFQAAIRPEKCVMLFIDF